MSLWNYFDHDLQLGFQNRNGHGLSFLMTVERKKKPLSIALHTLLNSKWPSLKAKKLCSFALDLEGLLCNYWISSVDSTKALSTCIQLLWCCIVMIITFVPLIHAINTSCSGCPYAHVSNTTYAKWSIDSDYNQTQWSVCQWCNRNMIS